MPIRSVFSSGATDVMVASAARTTSAVSSAVVGYGGARLLRAQVDVTAVSGTTPSLTVLLEDTIDGTNYYTIGTFAAKTAVGREAISITTPFTDTVRASWAITGTTPSFTFSVSVYSEA